MHNELEDIKKIERQFIQYSQYKKIISRKKKVKRILTIAAAITAVIWGMVLLFKTIGPGPLFLILLIGVVVLFITGSSGGGGSGSGYTGGYVGGGGGFGGGGSGGGGGGCCGGGGG